MVTMPFGKHRGFPLAAIDDNYLQWLLGRPDLHDWLRHAVERELADRRRSRRVHAAPDAEQRAGEARRGALPETRDVDKAVALEIITRGYRVLSLETHPDRGGDLARMQAVTVAARWLRQTVGWMLPEPSAPDDGT